MKLIPKNKKGGSIHIDPKNKGKFTATKKATGKTTEELTHSKNPLTRKRAIFAQNSKKWKHEDGGIMNDAKHKLEMPMMKRMWKENLTMPKYQNGGILNCDLSKILELWKK